MQNRVVRYPTLKQLIQLPNQNNCFRWINLRNNLLNFVRNLSMVFHMRLANMAINHVEQGIAHCLLFRVKVIQDENQQITQQANQGRFTTSTLSTIAGIAGTVVRISAQVKSPPAKPGAYHWGASKALVNL